jgi:hypothetical protein
MTGKSLKKTGTETKTGGAAQGSLLFASPQQGVYPRRTIQQGARSLWLHLRQTPASLALSHTNLGPGNESFLVVARNVVGQCQEFLPSGAKEFACKTTRSAHKVGFIREKGKAAPRDRQGTWKIGSSLLFT